jgi:hypothetical protein
VSGKRYELNSGNRTIALPPGRHEITVTYERCFHGPTQLLQPGASRSVGSVVGLVAFDAVAGGSYLLGCTAGGGGAMVSNAHWVDQWMPDGRLRRVADAKMGTDFPQELLGAEPPEPTKAPDVPIAPR